MERRHQIYAPPRVLTAGEWPGWAGAPRYCDGGLL